jgi:hypothetical protein
MPLWEATDEADWLAALNRYDEVLQSEKPRAAEGLDKWYREELPRLLRSRDPPHLAKAELVSLVGARGSSGAGAAGAAGRLPQSAALSTPPCAATRTGRLEAQARPAAAAAAGLRTRGCRAGGRRRQLPGVCGASARGAARRCGARRGGEGSGRDQGASLQPASLCGRLRTARRPPADVPGTRQPARTPLPRPLFRPPPPPLTCTRASARRLPAPSWLRSSAALPSCRTRRWRRCWGGRGRRSPPTASVSSASSPQRCAPRQRRCQSQASPRQPLPRVPPALPPRGPLRAALARLCRRPRP